MTKILADLPLDRQATGGQTSTIAEPSLACSGKRMMLTGNWFCSRSTDGGKNWRFIDPYTETPPTGAGFCCDQLVHYSKTWRLWIWMLQFSKDSSGNIIRVAVSASGRPGTWIWWDTAPKDVNSAWNRDWFDYPDLLETDQHLLLSFNMFAVSNNRWKRAAVLRFPLQALKDRGKLPRKAWSTAQFGSLRFAKGAGDSAFFAGQNIAASSIELFEWPDADGGVTQSSVTVGDWNDGPYDSDGPNNAAWLKRLDDRITGGWRAKGVLGFAWSASSDAAHPHPYIRVARIDETNAGLIDEPDLWSSDRAWAYPATAPNRRGDVGITAFCGGGGLHPNHAVGWLNESKSTWEMALGTASTHGPFRGKWGDYLDIQPDPSRKTYWLASGYVLNGGSNRRNITPRVVSFRP